MTTTQTTRTEAPAARHGPADGVRRPLRRRPRRHHRRRQRARRRAARPLPGARRSSRPTPGPLAERTGTDPRYVEEWLRGQAAGGYVEYDAATATYSMTPEQAFALTDPTGPVFLPGAFELALGALKARAAASRRRSAPARGVGWHEHDDDVFTGCERFFRPGYLMHLLTEWIPALDGRAGQARGGRDRSPTSAAGTAPRTLLMADALPAQPVHRLGLPRGLDRGRARAGRRGRAWRTGSRSRSSGAQSLDARDLDLVTTFDCLHDMGDPLGAAAPDPREPGAGRHLDDRRARRRRHRRVATSTRSAGCTTGSRRSCACRTRMSQPGGYALGAQAGEAAIRQVVTDAGFTRFRRVAETPFNLVYEARP